LHCVPMLLRRTAKRSEQSITNENVAAPPPVIKLTRRNSETKNTIARICTPKCRHADFTNYNL